MCLCLELNTETDHILLHFNETAENVDTALPIASHILHRTFLQGGNNRGVVIEYLELSHCSRNEDALNCSIEFYLLGRNYSKLQHNLNLYYLILAFCSLKQLLGLLLGVFNRTYIEECLLGQVVHLTIEDGVEALDGFFDRHHHTGQTGELRSH